jgi:hypothetical protein
MNIPTIYRNALSGYIIRPRTFGQMAVSALQGTFSLLWSEEDRSTFIDLLDKGVIQERVLGQATAGPAIMLSLFNDLQSPLFRRTQFNALEFLEGVGPALARFHNVSGALENQLRTIRDQAGSAFGSVGSPSLPSSGSDADVEETAPATTTTTIVATAPLSSKSVEETKNVIDGDDSGNKRNNVVTRKEKDAMLAAFRTTHSTDMFISKNEGRQAVAVLNTNWSAESKSNPHSFAGQFSKMVTNELFHMQEISAKTSCLLQDPSSTVSFKEESCTVNNVALLSARAKMFIEKEKPPRQNDLNSMAAAMSAFSPSQSSKSYAEVDYDPDDKETYENASIAAQLEVLYDVSQEFTLQRKSATSSSPSSTTEQTTFVGVATIQGWLKGGPDDGELRWRLALRRPAYEFPGIEHAYGRA